jgi:hypothetical protein
MTYKSIIKSFRPNIVESFRSFNHLIEMRDDGIVLVDRKETQYSSLEEARTNIKEEHIAKQLETEVSTHLYEEISTAQVANIIKEHHDVKVTDTLVESYLNLASSKMFSIDPVVQQIRSINKLDKLVEGKLHYVLEDESIVTISEQTQERLNNLLSDKTEVIEYMRESKDNFMRIVELTEE